MTPIRSTVKAGLPVATWGMTWSTRCAAVCAMRRAPHDMQKPLAGEGDDKFVVPAVCAAQPQESVGEDAAFEKSVELVLHELRQIRPGGGFGLGEEGRGMLLHQAVQRGQFQVLRDRSQIT